MTEENKYLGDGVYVSDDGYQIWLAANRCTNRVIALDSRVFAALLMEGCRLYTKQAYATMLRGVADRIDPDGAQE